MLPDIHTELRKRRRYNDKEKFHKCAQIAFRWVEETDEEKKTELSFQYYEAAGYNPSVIEEHLLKPPTDERELALTCCSNPKPVQLMEYTICDCCKRIVDESEVLMANYTDVSISAPNKVFILDDAAAGTSSVCKTGKKKGAAAKRSGKGSKGRGNNGDSGAIDDDDEEEDTASQASVPSKKKPAVWNRWHGIQKLLLRIHGQNSADYSKRWSTICTTISRELGVDLDDERARREVPYCDLYNSLPDSKTRRDGPVIWEAFTGNKLPQIPVDIIWVIEHVICKQLYEQDLKDYNDPLCKREIHRLSPATVLSQIVRLWPSLEPFYQFPDAQKGNVSAIKIKQYWTFHKEAAGWTTFKEPVKEAL